MNPLKTVTFCIGLLMAFQIFGQDRADPELERTHHERIQGRWDAVSLKLEGQKEDSNDWAESYEFSIDKVTSSSYPRKATPTKSLLASNKQNVATFELIPMFADVGTIEITKSNGKIVKGEYTLDHEYGLVLRLGPNENQRVTVLSKAPSPDGPNLAARDMKRLHGYWLIETNGQATAEQHFHFQGTDRKFVNFGDSTIRPIRLEPENALPQMIEVDPLRNKTLTTIYQFNGNRLKLCCGRLGAEAPTEFKNDEDKGWLNLTLRRVDERTLQEMLKTPGYARARFVH